MTHKTVAREGDVIVPNPVQDAMPTLRGLPFALKPGAQLDRLANAA
ncbi:hypothetical protein [Ruegeria sp.]|nr:hypothetical protein [Ruegeria sp.]MDA7965492.1 hypothetical protein [Ruegeria sp.]